MKRKFDNKDRNILYGVMDIKSYYDATHQKASIAKDYLVDYNYPSTQFSKILDFNVIYQRFLVVVHLQRLVMQDLLTKRYYEYNFDEKTRYSLYRIQKNETHKQKFDVSIVEKVDWNFDGKKVTYFKQMQDKVISFEYDLTAIYDEMYKIVKEEVSTEYADKFFSQSKTGEDETDEKIESKNTKSDNEFDWNMQDIKLDTMLTKLEDQGICLCCTDLDQYLEEFKSKGTINGM